MGTAILEKCLGRNTSTFCNSSSTCQVNAYMSMSLFYVWHQWASVTVCALASDGHSNGVAKTSSSSSYSIFTQTTALPVKFTSQTHRQAYRHLYGEDSAIGFNDFLNLFQDVVELCKAVSSFQCVSCDDVQRRSNQIYLQWYKVTTSSLYWWLENKRHLCTQSSKQAYTKC